MLIISRFRANNSIAQPQAKTMKIEFIILFAAIALDTNSAEECCWITVYSGTVYMPAKNEIAIKLKVINIALLPELKNPVILRPLTFGR